MKRIKNAFPYIAILILLALLLLLVDDVRAQTPYEDYMKTESNIVYSSETISVNIVTPSCKVKDLEWGLRATISKISYTPYQDLYTGTGLYISIYYNPEQEEFIVQSSRDTDNLVLEEYCLDTLDSTKIKVFRLIYDELKCR